MNPEDRKNKFHQIVSPYSSDEGVWIHQKAWFHIGKFDKGVETEYSLKSKGNGVYVFILSGDVTSDGISLNERDGLGIWEFEKLLFKADTNSEILLIEVPMND
jgi:redox-sensitive bicupin YhaK (pirin superfamily)